MSIKPSKSCKTTRATYYTIPQTPWRYKTSWREGSVRTSKKYIFRCFCSRSLEASRSYACFETLPSESPTDRCRVWSYKGAKNCNSCFVYRKFYQEKYFCQGLSPLRRCRSATSSLQDKALLILEVEEKNQHFLSHHCPLHRHK